ncbi:MAG: hypothetical protein UT61_C0011G0025 [Candidatus Woesebacteria bacterium GW2011_GWA1_39_8]|uniref:Uncharacterized protein n=1 Tax=Candidatus Woesebacteria bacterium GW2011_GWA1_39_8 TaxID=1618552 RepID=A0A0G0SX91_9BACT|nr:MAG: hypothetical protein UT61_C0011G0025 [Candidatus Woesebacteria bacterium GW2011_GWA1_39_8]
MEEPIENELPEDEEIQRLMLDHDVDEETAEKAQELIDEGIDEDEAIELAEDM